MSCLGAGDRLRASSPQSGEDAERRGNTSLRSGAPRLRGNAFKRRHRVLILVQIHIEPAYIT
ncbi:hypothetical protein EYF80_048549 [Liparis tanakae]|uniref:Uncharacterized protein n=1 Tax=Liparis tanakae TaxID=230148 RepID=A0A4Z2FKJ1_9TELE|nr:hypothetical protein EYF80_048549 [Liparis tanakae]